MARGARERLIGLAGELRDAADTLRSAEKGGAAPPSQERPAPSLDKLAESLLRQRHSRSRFLPPSLFHEPAWEILLSLYVAQHRGRTLNLKHLVLEVDAPVTTSQRWVDALAHMKLVHRVSDPQDRRRIELSLTPSAVSAVERYLLWLSSPEEPALASRSSQA